MDFEGCGFCPEGPHSRLNAVDESGHVLSVTLGYGNGATQEFRNGTAAWRPVVSPLLDKLGFHGVIYEVHTGTLNAPDWELAQADLRSGIDSGHEPRRSSQCCVVDGASQTIDAEGHRVNLVDGNDDGGGGWQRVRDEMRALATWLRS